MFKDLHRAGKGPRFMLRRLHDSVNELEHPTLQEPTNAFMASYETVEFYHPFQTSTSAGRPRLSPTTTTESPDDMERAHSITPSLENRKDSRQGGLPEIDICSSPGPLDVTQQELLEPEAPIQAEWEVITARSATNRLSNVVAAIRSLKMTTSPRRSPVPSSPSSNSSLDHTSARKEEAARNCGSSSGGCGYSWESSYLHRTTSQNLYASTHQRHR